MERIYNECNKIADMVMALEETITEEEGIKFKEALTELGYDVSYYGCYFPLILIGVREIINPN